MSGSDAGGATEIMNTGVIEEGLEVNAQAVNDLFTQLMNKPPSQDNLNNLAKILKDMLSTQGGRRRSSKKRGTQRKQKRRQRRGSRRAY